uniref:uncharacterized protein LOC101303284 n=1 Tax=Fragaria vesca subsp. vesca TaxID=101020 RepID=UPI0005C8B2E3|nr:PREDICTED: uncharacterized protein LOC101303284 [Fragaria vesca subsp. vesca]
MNVPVEYWGEVVISAAYLINRTPSRVIECENPLQQLQNLLSVPSLPNLEPRVFGCTVYVQIPKQQRSKLDPRARKCIFVGYADFQKGYRCYDPLTDTMHVSLDVSFRDSEPYYLGGVSKSSLQGERGCEGNSRHLFEFEEFEELETLESKFRIDKATNNNSHSHGIDAHDAYVTWVADMRTPPAEPHISEPSQGSSGGETHGTSVCAELRIPEPSRPSQAGTPTEEAIARVDSDTGLALQLASDSPTRVNNDTGSALVPATVSRPTYLTENCPENASSDVFPFSTPLTQEFATNVPPQVSLDSNQLYEVDNFVTRKSQRVTKGISKKQDEPDIKAKTKYPIANYMSNHRLVGSHALVINQLSSVSIPSTVQDVMTDPKWTQAMNEELEALQINSTWDIVPKPAGKKTVGCRWVFTVKLKADGSIDRYKARLVAKGYTQRYGIDYEETFASVAKINTVRILISLAATKDWPLRQFDVKNAFLNGNLEEEVYMDMPPGVKSRPCDAGKRKYVLDLLAKTGMFDCKPVETPIEMNHNLAIYPNQVPADKRSQFMHCPNKEHIDAVYRILKYLKMAPRKGFLFEKKMGELEVVGYTDADWVGDKTDRRSTSGYFTFVGGNLVTWRSKKQKVAARSSAEAEFRGMAHGVCEMLWIRNMLKELGLKLKQPMALHCDNTSAIEIAHNPVQHDRTKHVEVDRHFIKENLDRKIICFPFVYTEDQLADVLTKGVSRKVFDNSVESRISIIVFSKWCLDELVKILECKHSKNQTVWPIFYKVDPSDVRNQRGTYDQSLAFHEHQFRDNLAKVFGWRAALTEAANLAGWSFLDGYESGFIHDIVGEILAQVPNTAYLNVADYPVGLESRVLHVNMLLDVEEKDVRMVGIWGTGGIGKTTVAKAVYNSIVDRFEGSCFLENVRENSMKDGGLVELQNTILFDILGEKRLKVNNADRGINVIKKMLSHKRVLLVLDDVNHFAQLKKLVGGVDWFGIGSRIIITTRDKHLLTAHQIKLIYKVKELNYDEATALFSWNAFARKRHQVDELKVNSAVQYAQGLPLALIILGFRLCGRSADEWKEALDCYTRVPNQEIQEILKISYDALEDPVKEVFLDIACFFKGKTRNYVVETLECCELNPKYCIELLIDNALICIEGDHILMHDLAEEVGREVVRQESPTEPGRRSRLWFHEDVHHVLTENTGTDNIIGIMVNLPKSDVIRLNAESFSKMKNLRLFITCNLSFCGDVEYLPNKLRILDWPECPLKSFPSNFNPRKLVQLNMPCSHMTRLGEGFKNLHNVKSINFSGCKLLKSIPDFSGIPNLVYLNLNYCKSLVAVHPSVGFLKRLVHLSADKCSSLVMFPPRLSLRSLEIFLLGGCRKLKNFPEVEGTMKSLKFITLSGTAIRELPSSIGYLSGLQELNLNDCENLKNLPGSIYELQHLQYLFLDSCPKLNAFPHLENTEVSCSAKLLPLVLPKLLRFNMGGCNLHKSDFLATLGCVFTLQELDLSGGNFVSLPICISKFVNLLDLNLCGCKRLRKIPPLPPKVCWVGVGDCKSLETFPKLSNILESHDLQGLEWMDLFNCHRLCDNLHYEVAKMDNVFSECISQNFQIWDYIAR